MKSVRMGLMTGAAMLFTLGSAAAAPNTYRADGDFVQASSEDPVTGSAHAVLTPYWADRLGRTELTAYQASKRGGHVACRLAGDRVVLGGQCVTVIEGEFRL